MDTFFHFFHSFTSLFFCYSETCKQTTCISSLDRIFTLCNYNRIVPLFISTARMKFRIHRIFLVQMRAWRNLYNITIDDDKLFLHHHVDLEHDDRRVVCDQLLMFERILTFHEWLDLSSRIYKLEL